MPTPVLDALSILHSWAEGEAGNLDQALYEADNGEKQTVKEARDEFEVRATNMIQDLHELIRESQKTSWTTFTSKHL